MYDNQIKRDQLEATLEGKAMAWLNNFAAGHFADYEEVKTTFLNRFRKEKTPHEVLTKLKKIQQKDMLVEDYAQKLNKYLGRLIAEETPTNEMLAGYFINGLKKSLRSATGGVDVGIGLENLIDMATRAEKRFGVTNTRKVSKKSKKKKGKKDRQSSDDESEEDSDDFDLDNSDDDDDSESDSDDDLDSKIQKQRKGKKKTKDDKKSKGKGKEEDSKIEKLLSKKLKELGVQKDTLQKLAPCEICEKVGHKAAQRWYNPNYRGPMPARLRQKMAEASGRFPDQGGQL